jgi:hypothetical protein
MADQLVHKCSPIPTGRMRRIQHAERCLALPAHHPLQQDGKMVASLKAERDANRAHLTSIGHCQECGYHL